MAFGKEIFKKEFLLNPDCVFLNHGSYGAVPRSVFEERMRLQRELELHPDDWFRQKEERFYYDNLRPIAHFLGSKPENLVFVENATSGLNSVLKSLPLKEGDGILSYSWTYNAIKNTMLATAGRTGVEVHTVDISLPVRSVEQFVDRFRQSLQKHQNIKIVVLDYIASATATRLPLKQLVALCKEQDVLVALDAAHAPGQINLNLEQLGDMGVDFFTGNLHKWMFVPRGCAVLWCHPRHHKTLRPVVTSHNLNCDNFQDDFFTQATRDKTPYMVVNTALQFVKDVGGLDAIIQYNSGLLDEAVELLTKAWNTERFPIPAEMEAPYMRVIAVPELKKFPPPPNLQNAVFGDQGDLMVELRKRFSIQTVFLRIYGKLWVRISGQIYNDITDYQRLADAITTLIEEDKQ